MPIDSILTQPAAASINAAYRPIQFIVQTSGDPAPPVVYCDIYINDVYYKSLSKTQPSLLSGSNQQWTFDIQDACQEVLSTPTGANGGTDFIDVLESLCQAYCKFRSSTIDVLTGFIVPDAAIPIQGTGSTEPTSGDGTQSNEITVINSTIQHSSNQDLATHLNSYKTGIWIH